MLPPEAPRRPHSLTAFGHTRTDEWFWLRAADDPDVIAHLEAENRYCDEVMAPTAPLQQQLFEEIRSRVHETDAGPPGWSGGWWYYSRTTEGLQYPALCRRPDRNHYLRAPDVAAEARAGRPDGEETVLDENRLAEGHDYFAVGVLDLSPDHGLLAYATDTDGSERYTLRFRALDSGDDLPDVVEGVYYGSAWAAGGRCFFYVRPDPAMRPWQVWCHQLGADPATDRLVYQEDDERFFVSVELSRSRSRVVITSASKTTAEVRWLDASDPGGQPAVLIPRADGVEYGADHDGGDSWLVLSNAPLPDGSPATNFALYRMAGGGTPEVVLAHRPEVKVESVEAFSGFAAVVERSATDGLQRIRLLDRSGGDHTVDQPDAAYSLVGGQNPEWEAGHYRFGYTSLVTPTESIDFHLGDRRREAVWRQLVEGYDPAAYRTERIWAAAPDAAMVAVDLVCRADHPLDGTAPGLLYGYGAYEHSIEAVFSPVRLNLVERGLLFAVAHVRGGGELGRAWYEQGRMEHKEHTFTDFIAAAEELIGGGWVAADRLAARGGSAGGLLMGAVLNLRPDLWRAVVAEVPFVDVVTTMSDVTLPLTVTEWEEWGDPVHDEAAYRRMLSYSPYDNVAPRVDWPALFVTAGLHDPRVGFWEPAKWVAKLRSCGAGRERPLVLRTEMGAGHQGASGRYDTWRDEARIQAFLLTELAL